VEFPDVTVRSEMETDDDKKKQVAAYKLRCGNIDRAVPYDFSVQTVYN